MAYCVFCGGRPVTREHVWPEWISGVLAQHVTAPFNVSREERQGEIKDWQSHHLDITVRRFCKSCNNTWMSQLENEASPILKRMILGRIYSMNLSMDEQVILSRWAYKTSLVADFALPGEQIIPEETYRAFFQQRIPPRVGAIVWTTAYGGPSKAAHGYRRKLSVIGVGPDGKDVQGTEQHAFVTTFSVFRVIFQVVGYVSGNWAPTKDTAETNRFLIRLWPPTNTVANWPRNGLALDDKGLVQLSRREDFD